MTETMLAGAAAAALYSFGWSRRHLGLHRAAHPRRPIARRSRRNDAADECLRLRHVLFRFRQSGYFHAPLAGTLLAFSAPAAFASGMIPPSAHLFAFLVGCALLLAAYASISPTCGQSATTIEGAALWTMSAIIGTVLGPLAGFTGGGGIYLSPRLIFLG